MGVQAKKPFLGGPSVFENINRKQRDFIRDKCKKKVLTGIQCGRFANRFCKALDVRHFPFT